MQKNIFSRLYRRIGLGALMLTALFCGSADKVWAVRPLKFVVMSDIHAPDVPDGRERLEAILEAARAAKVDFIIELGDFCRLDEPSRVYRDLWNAFPADKYHVIGNHDMDRYTPEEYVKGMGMPGRYYAFDKGDYRFIVLDGNNTFDGRNYTHYAKANYGGSRFVSYFDPEQREWLRRTLAETDKRCILFSHQSMERESPNGVYMRAVLEEANAKAGYQKVVMAFSGHNHSNYVDRINGISYMQINSASYVWVGEKTQSEKRFPAEINKRFGLLPWSIVYDKPLYAIVTLTPGKVSVKGTKASFMPPTPQEMGMPDKLGLFPLVSDIKDAVIRYK